MFEPFLVGGLGLLALCLAWGIIHGLLEALKHGCPRRLRKRLKVTKRRMSCI